jgi:hypothetical protein
MTGWGQTFNKRMALAVAAAMASRMDNITKLVSARSCERLGRPLTERD